MAVSGKKIVESFGKKRMSAADKLRQLNEIDDEEFETSATQEDDEYEEYEDEYFNQKQDDISKSIESIGKSIDKGKQASKPAISLEEIEREMHKNSSISTTKPQKSKKVVVDANVAFANRKATLMNSKYEIEDDRDTEEVQSLDSTVHSIPSGKRVAPKKEKIDSTDLLDSSKTQALIAKPLVYWRSILAKEIQVYVCGQAYIGKAFDEINYRYMGEDSAKQMVKDNLYALMRFKYFKKMSDASEDRIKEIAKAFTENLKSSLIKVSFNQGDKCMLMKKLPDYCVAFNNGVFDFKKNDWMFKYDIIEMPELMNRIYAYDPEVAIMWHFNIEFDPLPINILETPLEEFVRFMKEITKKNKNYCFELIYNMCHDMNDKFSMKRFIHLCEIMGYTMIPGFVQKFVMLVGSGGNGKNSLFDGCFSNNVIPKPIANSLTDIETDKFVTGTFENVYHNIFLETEAKPISDSKMIKQLTGTMDGFVESKGKDRRNAEINCKFIFSANDQEKVKFGDNTDGFRRRINLFEIWYKWDKHLNFMKKGDYYNVTFSYDLHEIKEDIMNAIAYVYFAMYGILSATKNFSSSFDFSENDWKLSYSDIDFDLKDTLDSLTIQKVLSYMNKAENRLEAPKIFFDNSSPTRKVLYQNDYLNSIGINTYDKMVNMLKDDEARFEYFTDNNVYISLNAVQKIVGDNSSTQTFNSNFKKMYVGCRIDKISGNHNKPYVLVNFANDKMRVKC